MPRIIQLVILLVIVLVVWRLVSSRRR